MRPPLPLSMSRHALTLLAPVLALTSLPASASPLEATKLTLAFRIWPRESERSRTDWRDCRQASDVWGDDTTLIHALGGETTQQEGMHIIELEMTLHNCAVRWVTNIFSFLTLWQCLCHCNMPLILYASICKTTLHSANMALEFLVFSAVYGPFLDWPK